MPWSQVLQLRDSFLLPSRPFQREIKSVDVRAYAQYGRFLVSNADKFLRRNEIVQAKLMLNDWIPLHAGSASPLVLKAVLMWKLTMAKAYRYEGSFVMALQLLQDVWESYRHVPGYHELRSATFAASLVNTRLPPRFLSYRWPTIGIQATIPRPTHSKFR